MGTPVTKTFKMTAPITSAGMAFVARPELAAAVSNAGGLGFLAAEMTPPHQLAERIRATRRLTSRPFGIEFMTPYFTKWHLDACVVDPVAVVTFFWGIPERSWVERLQDAGCQVWMKAGSLDEARQAERQGADVVIVEAPEAGPFANTRLLELLGDVAAGAKVPVIASVASVDGAGLVALLGLGAAAVRCGTLFLSAEEADAKNEYARSMTDSPLDATLRVNLLAREWPDRPTPALNQAAVSDWLRGCRETGDRPTSTAEATSSSQTASRIASLMFLGETAPWVPAMELTPPTIQPAAEIVAGVTRDARRILAKQHELSAVA